MSTPWGQHTERVDKSDTLGALLVAVLGTSLYVALRAINYDPNGIATAQAVESAGLTWPNHMFFELIAFVIMKAGRLVGYSAPSYGMLQVLAGASGGIALGCAYLLARRLGADRLCAYAAVLWLGGTWSFWNWSTNVAYISHATMWVAVALLFSLKKGGPTTAILTGTAAAFSVLTWQANVFAVPFLLLVGFMEAESAKTWVRWSFGVLCTFAAIVGTAYVLIAYAAYSYNPDFHNLIVLFTTHGGIENTSTSWGHWGWDRPGSLLQTWLFSAIGAARGWALYALVAFTLGALLNAVFKPKDRSSLICLAGIAAYLPFIIWWDPYETKWLLIPNLFLAVLAARSWSQWRERLHWTVGIPVLLAVGFLFWSNLSMYAMPAHTQASEGTLLGDCVGAKLGQADLYIQPDWAFGGYMSYKYRIDLIDLISEAQVARFDRAAMMNSIRTRVEAKHKAGAAAYTLDPTSLSAGSADILEKLGQIKATELDQLLPGKIAFSCRNWNIRRLD
jgi:hypothetical protein